MTHGAAAEDYQAFVRRAQADDNVLGVIVVVEGWEPDLGWLRGS